MKDYQILAQGAIHLSPKGIRDLNQFLQSWAIWPGGEVKVVIEKQQGFAGAKSCRTNFGVGRNYGMILSLLHLNEITYTEVLPRTWINSMAPLSWEERESYGLKKGEVKETKSLSLGWVQKLYPDITVRTPKGVWLDGIADAIMLARYYTELIKGET